MTIGASTDAHRAPRGEAASAAESQSGLAIEVVDLVKRYGKMSALAGLSLTVGRGEVFGFLGPNGAGKTTAVKLLMGLGRPTSGRASVLGAPLGDLSARARIGYLPELFRYQAWLSAREVLQLHCALAGIPAARHRAEIDTSLDRVGLTSRADDRVGTFSKGMQQRLGLGVALLGSPELVFLDEPTSALDPVGRHDVREIIRDLKRRGTAVFLNSHLLTEVEQVCDRVAVVDHGRVIASGSLEQLLGGGRTVRVNATGLTAASESQLREQFGALAVEGDWYAFHSVPDTSVPEVVATVVRLGGQVYGVESRSESLEDRFLQLLGESGGA